MFFVRTVGAIATDLTQNSIDACMCAATVCLQRTHITATCDVSSTCTLYLFLSLYCLFAVALSSYVLQESALKVASATESSG